MRTLARLSSCWGAAILLTLPLSAVAESPAVTGRCAVKFFATSTLHDFEGDAPCASLAIDAPDARGHYAARAEVEVARLDTGIAARDRKLRETFEATKFPRIAARFASVDPAALRSGKLPFVIAIHGVEQPVVAAISEWRERPGQSAHFRATFTLSLRDFRLEPPVAMGFIRVDDPVRVRVDVDLASASAPEKP